MNLLDISAVANFDTSRVYRWEIPINRFLSSSDNDSQFVRNLCSQLLVETNRRDGLSGADFDVMFVHHSFSDDADYNVEWSFSLGL